LRRGAFITVSLAAVLISCGEQKTEEIQNTNPTWAADIAPIIYKNCTPCHRPGEAGSFDLLSYAQAKQRSKLIRFVTKTRYMPP